MYLLNGELHSAGTFTSVFEQPLTNCESVDKAALLRELAYAVKDLKVIMRDLANIKESCQNEIVGIPPKS
jgi:hypothetical protein